MPGAAAWRRSKWGEGVAHHHSPAASPSLPPRRSPLLDGTPRAGGAYASQYASRVAMTFRDDETRPGDRRPKWSVASPERTPSSPTARAKLIARLTRSAERRVAKLEAAASARWAAADGARRRIEALDAFSGARLNSPALRDSAALERAGAASAIRAVEGHMRRCASERDVRRLVVGTYAEGADEGAPLGVDAVRRWLHSNCSRDAGGGDDDGDAPAAAIARFAGALTVVLCGPSGSEARATRPAPLRRWRAFLARAAASARAALDAANSLHGEHYHVHGAARLSNHSPLEHALSRLGGDPAVSNKLFVLFIYSYD